MKILAIIVIGIPALTIIYNILKDTFDKRKVATIRDWKNSVWLCCFVILVATIIFKWV